MTNDEGRSMSGGESICKADLERKGDQGSHGMKDEIEMVPNSDGSSHRESSYGGHRKRRRSHEREKYHRSSGEKLPRLSNHAESHQVKEKSRRDRSPERSRELSDRDYNAEESWERHRIKARSKERKREKDKYQESSRERDRGSQRSRDRNRGSPRDYNDGDSDSDDRSRYYSGHSRSRGDRERYRRRSQRSPSARDDHRDRGRDSEYYGSITPLHLRKSKLNNWDVPPAEYPGVSARQVKASGIFPIRGSGVVDDSAHSTDYGVMHSQGRSTSSSAHGANHHSRASGSRKSSRDAGGVSPTNSTSTAGNTNSLNASSSQSNNLSRQARRLYVGNLPYDVVEDALVDFLNDTMVQWNFAKRGSTPVIFAQINHDKSFAFVEFRTPEDATAAMAFDGLTFLGQSLKIRRPKDYQPQSGSFTQSPSVHMPGVVSTNVPDSSDKIFIGGLPLFLNGDQVIELLKSFGELKAFNLVRDGVHGASKGFAFCEYADPSVTDAACQGLNGMEIGDRRIVVQRASVGSGTRLGSGPLPTNLSLTNFPPASASTIPSNSLVLLNMLTFDDIIDDKEYDDIMVDIREECEKFGEIVTISIPRTSDTQNSTSLAKVYVEFSTQESCAKALNSLAGRKFLDRTVITTYCNHPIPS